MNKDEMWKIIADKNPAFAGDESDHVTQTLRGVKKLFDAAYDAGHEQGVRNGRAAEALEQEAKNKLQRKNDLFDKFFGGRL